MKAPNIEKVSDITQTLLFLACKAKRNGNYEIHDLELFEKVLKDLIGCEIVKYRLGESEKYIEDLLQKETAFYISINGRQYVALPPIFHENTD